MKGSSEQRHTATCWAHPADQQRRKLSAIGKKILQIKASEDGCGGRACP